jgi:hypothetical protein
VTLGISGGGSLTGPLRGARRFPSTRWYPVPETTRTTSGFGICLSFKDHFLSRRAKPYVRFATWWGDSKGSESEPPEKRSEPSFLIDRLTPRWGRSRRRW